MPPKSPVGYVGDEAHDNLVKFYVEQEAHYRGELSSYFGTFLENWKLYLAERPDRRREGEEWRANVFVPYPFSGLETKVAAILDLINSADRYVQVEGVGPNDDESATGPENLIDHTLRRNMFRTRIAGQVMRAAGIQGAEAYQISWRRRTVPVSMVPNVADIADLKEAIAEAVQNGAPEPPSPISNPALFRMWAEDVVKAGKAKAIPSIDVESEIKTFDGPYIQRVSITDLRFDPRIEEWSEQPIIYKRSIVDERFVRAMVAAGKMDGRQVAEALQGSGGGGEGLDDEFQTWTEQVGRMLGVSMSPTANPLRKRPIEIFEIYAPQEDIKYAVMMNRKAIVNTNPTRMPFDHQQPPVQLYRNHPIPGFAIGMSEFKQPKALYHEMNSLRSMRLDAVLIALLPVLLRQKGAGMPDMRRLFRPGVVLDVEGADAIKQLIAKTVPPEAFREIFDIKTDIDETNSTPSQLRGGAATVGRVSATEAQTRVSQAMVRMKDSLVRAEDEFNPLVTQPLFLWYQIGQDEIRLEAAGGRDPYVVSKKDIFEALGRDFRFRGASRAVNRELAAQQTMQWLKDFGVNLAPEELRAGMGKAYELLGLKGVEKVLNPKWTSVAQKAWETKMGLAGSPVDPSRPSLPSAGGENAPAPIPAGTPVDVGEEIVNSLKYNEGGGLQAPGNVQQGPGQAPPPDMAAEVPAS